MTLIAAGVGVVCLAGLLAAWTISIKPRRMRADLAARSAAAAAASAMPPRPDLSLDDQLTIGRACSPLQAKGDDLGYRQCKTTQLAIAASTTRPSLEGIPLHIVMNARAACEQFQIRGDIAGHRACFQKKLAEPRP